MKSVPSTDNNITIHQGHGDTQTAILNVLTDYQAIARESVRSRRAILNVLEDLEKSNAILQEKTREMAEASDRLMQKNAIDTAILESIGDAIIVADSARSITFVNRAFELLTGWTAAEVIGCDIVTILSTENEPGSIETRFTDIITATLNGNTYRGDVTNPSPSLRKDTTRFPASSTVTPVWLHGTVVGLVKSYRDITKELDVDKAKTEFVSLASHQLRTPLSAINWYTEMLLSGDAGPISEIQEKYLNEVYHGNQRMISLVNALLNVTRMTLGTFILEPEMIDLVSLIHSVLLEQIPESEKKHLQINTIFDPSIPIIESDAKLLRMVMQNLISNAIKYTPQDGTIDLTLGLNPAGTHFIFSVADSGVGIPASQQERIFTRLFRADNVRIQETEGTGLGLYIVKAIIENSGGRVWFESEENVGSTFYVELPVGRTLTH